MKQLLIGLVGMTCCFCSGCVNPSVTVPRCADSPTPAVLSWRFEGKGDATCQWFFGSQSQGYGNTGMSNTIAALRTLPKDSAVCVVFPGDPVIRLPQGFPINDRQHDRAFTGLVRERRLRLLYFSREGITNARPSMDMVYWVRASTNSPTVFFHGVAQTGIDSNGLHLAIQRVKDSKPDFVICFDAGPSTPIGSVQESQCLVRSIGAALEPIGIAVRGEREAECGDAIWDATLGDDPHRQ